MPSEVLPEPGETVLISACLTGVTCNYRGCSCESGLDIEALSVAYRLVPVCPEQLGGMSTPRIPSEIVGGDGQDVLDGRARVLSRSGNDVSPNFIRGAEACLQIARVTRASWAILQSRSPSCGRDEIHAGRFDGTLTRGTGVTAARLSRAGVRVVDASIAGECWNAISATQSTKGD